MAARDVLEIGAAKQRLSLALRPRVVLIGLTSCAMQFPGDAEDRIAVSDRVSHAEAAGPDAAAWSASTVSRVTALDADPDIRALRQRLFDAGVASAFEGDHDDDGLWTSLVLRCPRTQLAAVETLAADDAGIDAADRPTATERFITYMLRNHHRDWQANRARLPDVGESPYTPHAEWNLLVGT
ncbi:hypothetical protein [Sphingopyxis sp.]|jgi:hypothetical protein|uniref:hypothetical protein n=1 Tax=Sphingopyxis sp. TaxID=1908224 RepID=UPI0025F7FCA1|nr:hypothetical protein [Sphingopyxis sp.]MBK6412618.1 hypothetical protein [Sphingopyxis sp.]